MNNMICRQNATIGRPRQLDDTLEEPGRDYRVISLYSGAGGLDAGFAFAGGFKLVYAIDSDPLAIDTYRANLGDHAVVGCLPESAPPADLRPDVVIGGPPCQGFSVAGRMDPRDARSNHVFTFLDQVQRLEPEAFVMENVKALGVNPRWAHIRRRIHERARGMGYTLELLVLNAADYGVPQARERMFLIGVQHGSPMCPAPLTKSRPKTAGDALRELPPLGAVGNDSLCAARVVPASKPVMRPTAHMGSLLFNGSGRPLDLARPAKTLPASMGGNATPIVDQQELDSGAESWVVAYHAHLAAGGDPLAESDPRMRRLTVEEAAALQSFPPGWTFKGPRGSRYRQIGNAVPPELARRVAISVRHALDAHGVDRRGAQPVDERPLAAVA
jgi:DNA (cytosine-5)-methyltransferase 1